MAIVDRNRKQIIDLAGPEGNAFWLLGHTRYLGKQLGWEQKKISALMDEMMSGDYKNLVTVFDREFGEVVDLMLPEKGL